jgi:proteasome lid subunit RPN8/RPN11
MADREEITAKIDIQLIIPLASYRKLMAYVMAVDSEISGFANVEYNKAKKSLVMGEVFLLEQTSGAAHTHIDEEEVSKFNTKLVQKGVTQLPRLWWHSHDTMGAFFSATDETTLKDFETNTFMVALVVNKRKEMQAKFILFEPIYVEVDDIPIIIDMEYPEIPASILKEVERKVNKPKPIILTGTPDSEKKGSHSGGIILPNEDNGETWDRKRKIFSIKRISKFLPKDPSEAEDRVANLGLTMHWDTELNEYIYISEEGDVWIDYWDSLGTSMMGKRGELD